MGYLSDVAYTIRFNEKGKDLFETFLAEAKSKDLGAALDECEVDMDRKHINFFADSQKWYDTFPEVQVHTRLIELAEAWIASCDHIHAKETGEVSVNVSDYPLGYIFIRIGEDTDDIATEFGGDYVWDWMQVSRQIVTDWQ